jgi:hypothetical protein
LQSLGLGPAEGLDRAVRRPNRSLAALAQTDFSARFRGLPACRLQLLMKRASAERCQTGPAFRRTIGTGKSSSSAIS